MSYCTSDILPLASGIYQDLGSPGSQSVGYISGVLTSSGFLGSLNNKLFTSFYLSGSNPCITDAGGGFGAEEADIMELMYKTDYYELRALSILDGGGTFWTSLSEGDSKITRESTANLSKQYLALQSSSQQTLRIAIGDYQRRISSPQSVDAASLYSFPSP